MPNEYDLLAYPISYSQISTFLTCRYQWFLRYALGIRTKYRGPAMEVGDAVHRALASFLTGGDIEDGIDDWYRETLKNLPVEVDGMTFDHLDELTATATAIAYRALDGLQEAGLWSFLDTDGKPYVEHSFNVPLKTWKAGLIAKIDYVAYEPVERLVWVVDWKTRGYFSSYDDETANLQNAIYQKAALSQDIDSVGTITFQIKSTAPKTPKLNKDGSMSRAAIACDWKTYASALTASGLDPVDYLDMRDKLNENVFVTPTAVVRSRETVDYIWTELVESTAAQIKAAYLHWQKYGRDSERTTMLRNFAPRTCSNCHVRPICHGDINQRGVSDLLETMFDSSDNARARFAE